MKWVWKVDGQGNISDRRMPGCDRAAFDAWDAAMKRRLGWRAGLDFGRKRDSGGGWTLASRHWPHKLCWDWFICWQPRGALADGERRVGVIYCYRHLAILLGRASIAYHWQDYGDMVAGQYKAEAPVVRYPWGGVGGGEKGRLPRSIRKLLDVENDD